MMVMAEVLAISPSALSRWLDRRQRPATVARCGRPCVIDAEARERIRACYAEHLGQWGPQVLAGWCRREGLGDWSASTVAVVVADLREPKPAVPPPVRYEITASNVMWSEDGTGIKLRGRKQELLVVQDEHARCKLNWELADGPATSKDVHSYPEQAFGRHGAPLVLKHDGDAIFHTPEVEALLEASGSGPDRTAGLSRLQRQAGAFHAGHQELRVGHETAWLRRASRRTYPCYNAGSERGANSARPRQPYGQGSVPRRADPVAGSKAVQKLCGRTGSNITDRSKTAE